MTSTEGRDRTVILSAALVDVNRIWNELENQTEDCCRAKLVDAGLSVGSRYLYTLGFFSDVPVLTSDVKLEDGSIKLLQVDAADLRNTGRKSDIRYYLFPSGDLVRAEYKGGKLLLDEMILLDSDNAMCTIGIPTLRAIKETLLRSTKVPAWASLSA